MVQDTLLSEVDLSYLAPTGDGRQEMITVPAPVLIKAAMAAAGSIESGVTDVPPPYTPAAKRRSMLKVEVGDVSGLKSKTSIQSTLPMYSVYPMYQSGETSIFSSPSTYSCQYCTREQNYWETISDGDNWIPLLLQIMMLPWAFFTFVASTMLFAISAALFVLFPVGPVISWCSCSAVRQLAIFELKFTSYFRKPVEVCLHCNPYGPPELDLPHAVYVRQGTGSSSGFFSRMVDPLRDEFTWRSFGYFMFVQPFVAVVSFAYALISFVLGLVLFPLLPMFLKGSKALGQYERTISRKVLAVF